MAATASVDPGRLYTKLYGMLSIKGAEALLDLCIPNVRWQVEACPPVGLDELIGTYSAFMISFSGFGHMTGRREDFRESRGNTVTVRTSWAVRHDDIFEIDGVVYEATHQQLLIRWEDIVTFGADGRVTSWRTSFHHDDLIAQLTR